MSKKLPKHNGLAQDRALISLEKKLGVLLKDKTLDSLNNTQRAALVYKLRHAYRLTLLFKVVGIKPSTYYYQLGVIKRGDKYETIKKEILNSRNSIPYFSIKKIFCYEY
ncbi:hypothetical protein [Basilea psittacipulmonis]|uniref:Uncharacterized protein n=1 Tax=Basilea psittacipulmonis DSM 24701 TaxID=1072685 RepID=A0A077DF54_9BURK|nr:hypothetical protein [Basilea psittacipulmonis]AIL32741.1 hypothetical protein IX83_04955 [Basilea psittacipulmonis DSM 24701]